MIQVESMKTENPSVQIFILPSVRKWNLITLAFWTNFGPNWPNLALYGQYLAFWFQIYAQEWRVYRKLVLFASIKNSTWFLLYGPILFKILAHMGQIFPSKNNIWTFNIRFKLRARDYVEKWSYLPFKAILPNFGLLDQFSPIFWSKRTKSCPLWTIFVLLM